MAKFLDGGKNWLELWSDGVLHCWSVGLLD
jgi:hypothetical protein